jgi:hypothetical protein
MRAEQSTVAVGVFTDSMQARDAVAALKEANFRSDQISLLAPNPDETTAAGAGLETSSGEGAVAGALLGGLFGGLWGWFAGFTALFIPGVGPFLAVGAFATALTGAALGAGLGAIAGALIGLGVPKEEAEWYEGELRGGRTLVAVAADGRHGEARELLRRHGAYDIESRTIAPTTSASELTDTRPASSQTIRPAASTTLHPQDRPAEPALGHATPASGDAPIGAGIAFGHEDEPRQAPVPAQSPEYPVAGGPVPSPLGRTTDPATYAAGAPQPPPSALPGRWDDQASDYRQLWQQRPEAQRGRWEEDEPLYRYGWESAASGRYRGRAWLDAEPELRRDWEAHYPQHPWDRVADSVRHAWEHAMRSPAHR